MNRRLIEAAVALADTLARENAALAKLDLARAAAMLPEKQLAVASFTAAQQMAAAAMSDALDEEQRQLAEGVATRLLDLANENRRLLERGTRVQGRVLATVVKAVPRALAPAPRYGATGALARTPKTPPVIVSARV